MVDFFGLGFIGTLEALGRIVRAKHPARWAADQIPEAEAAIWNGLGSAPNPELWLEQLRDLKNHHSRLADRACDYVEARDVLRAALFSSEIAAKAADESGQLRDIFHRVWCRESAADVVEKGRGVFEGLGQDERLILMPETEVTYFVSQLAGLGEAAKDGGAHTPLEKLRVALKAVMETPDKKVWKEFQGQHLAAATKLSEADLWQMYRHPASVDALIPVAIVLRVLREENPDGKGDERALRFSHAIAHEMEERGGLDDIELSFVFEGHALPIDPAFYRERLNSYAGTDKSAPSYGELETFVRQTWSDNLLIPLDRLIALHEQGHLPLPAALLRKHRTLLAVASPREDEAVDNSASTSSGVAGQHLTEPAGSAQPRRPLFEQAIEFFGRHDLSVEHEIAHRVQRIDADNAFLFARERGFNVGKTIAWAAVRQFIAPQRGRPRKKS